VRASGDALTHGARVALTVAIALGCEGEHMEVNDKLVANMKNTWRHRDIRYHKVANTNITTHAWWRSSLARSNWCQEHQQRDQQDDWQKSDSQDASNYECTHTLMCLA
jgi:hypothetical protein